MTRSDLVEELAARFGQLTHKDAESAVKAFAVLAASQSATVHHALVATRALAKVLRFRRNACPISKQAKRCAKLSMYKPKNHFDLILFIKIYINF
jgi:hypothetical protein